MPLRENFKYKKIAGHLTGWVFFILYDGGFPFLMNGSFDSLRNLLFFYTCNITLFYIVYHILNINIGGKKPSYPKALILTVSAVLLFTIIKSAWEIIFLPIPDFFTTGFILLRRAFINDLVRSTYYAGLGALIWSAGHVAGYRKEAYEAEIKKLHLANDNAILKADLADAQNAYLKQQLNPHLLLNTLNFIYNTVDRYSEEGAEVVLKLAEIMRYSIAETSPDGKVALADEIRQLHNLILINRRRFHFPLSLDVNITTIEKTWQIIPLVLITLTENMFKHGKFKGHNGSISLSITDSGLLKFRTFNYKRNHGSENEKSPIGMINTRLRLDYAYGTAYSLTTIDHLTNFQVDLTIQL